MSDLSSEQQEVLNRFSADSLRAQTEKIIDLVTQDAFAERVSAVINAPKDEQLNLAAATLTPDALREAGINIDEMTRISSRYFEEGANESYNLGSGIADAMPITFPGAIGNPEFGPIIEKYTFPNPDNPFPAPHNPFPAPHNPFPIPANPDLAPKISIPGSNAWSACVCIGAGGCVGVGGGT